MEQKAFIVLNGQKIEAKESGSINSSRGLEYIAPVPGESYSIGVIRHSRNGSNGWFFRGVDGHYSDQYELNKVMKVEESRLIFE